MIFRSRHRNSFTTIDNMPILDDRLSMGALGLLLYLFSKPDDWRVTAKDLQRRFGAGKNQVYRLINELIEAGYVRRSVRRDDDRRTFSQFEYDVTDRADLEIGTDVGQKAFNFNAAVSPKSAISPKQGNGSTPEAEGKNLNEINEAISPKAASGNRGRILKTDSTKREDEESSTAKATKKRKLVPLPAGWQPSPDDLAYAGDKGFSPAQTAVLAEAFADHHRKKATEWADWSAAWRTWVRNEIKFNGAPRLPDKPRGRYDELWDPAL